MPKLMRKSEFAKHIGHSPSYVTALAKSDRLVLDGKMVAVAASLRRIRDTEDPNRSDVRERFAANKGDDDGDAHPDREVRPPRPGSFQHYRTEKMRADAQHAQMELDRLSGNLVDVSSVKTAGVEIGAAFRSAIENMCDQLAPLLAAKTDEAEVHSILMDHGENVLTDLAHKLKQLATVSVERA